MNFLLIFHTVSFFSFLSFIFDLLSFILVCGQLLYFGSDFGKVCTVDLSSVHKRHKTFNHVVDDLWDLVCVHCFHAMTNATKKIHFSQKGHLQTHIRKNHVNEELSVEAWHPSQRMPPLINNQQFNEAQLQWIAWNRPENPIVVPIREEREKRPRELDGSIFFLTIVVQFFQFH